MIPDLFIQAEADYRTQRRLREAEKYRLARLVSSRTSHTKLPGDRPELTASANLHLPVYMPNALSINPAAIVTDLRAVRDCQASCISAAGAVGVVEAGAIETRAGQLRPVRAAAGRVGGVEPLGEELVQTGAAGRSLVRHPRVELGL